METWIRRVRHSMAASGWRRTFGDGLMLSVNRLLAEDAEHRWFDRKFGTDTAGRVEPEAMDIDPTARETARVYMPSPPQVTRWALRHSGVDPREFTFIDVGCGKGRVLLIAAEFPFRAIHGVDISGALCASARRNIAIYPPRVCRNIHVQAEDATKFVFPAGNLFIHFYHSFAVELLLQMLQPLEATGREILLTYLLYKSDVPAVKAAFTRLPWLSLVREEQSLTGQYEWLFYSNRVSPSGSAGSRG